MVWKEIRSKFTRNLAVVIGIDNYENERIHDLSTPVNDASAIADLLETDYAYKQDNLQTKVIRLLDEQATLTGIRDLLTKTLPELQMNEFDRLIFYFAGHGLPCTNEDGPEGYLVPQDADLTKPNSFLPMREVAEELNKLACHHLLLILDCCFAGTFHWAPPRRDMIPVLKTIHQEHYYRFIRYPAWHIITSSAHDQEALDVANLDVAKLDQNKRDEEKKLGYDGKLHSPFALALLKGLQHNEETQQQHADLIADGVVTAHELFTYLEQQVSELSKNQQTPGHYPRRDYDKGQFIFTSPNFDPKKQLKPAPKLNEENNPYRGLKSFDEKHAQFFFGRQVLVEALIKRLCQPEQTLQVVLGVSGSGKSSLVKAGLLPRLRTDKHQWYILEPMRPQAFPFSALARVLLPVVNPALIEQLAQVSFLDKKKLKQVVKQPDQTTNSSNQAADSTTATTEPLQKLAANWGSAQPEAKLLLIEDYFVQLEALCSPEERRSLNTLHQALLSEIDLIVQQLQQNPHYLSQEIQKWSQAHPNTTLLLVIDQFEELITMSQNSSTENREAAQAGIIGTSDLKQLPFLETLREAIAACPRQWRVVVTLRSDFEPRFLDSPLQAYWQAARFPVRAMNSDELRQAIEGPALKQALYFEPDNLVGMLIDEVGQMPGALPLLSFTLSELYVKLHKRWTQDESTDRALRIKDYEDLGGVAGALTQRATAEYESQEWNDLERATMRRVMLRMVTIEGSGVARRQVPDSELVYPSAEENQRREEVINQLVNVRLLVKGQEAGRTYVEPAHDFLLCWNKFQEWIEQEKEDLALQQRLTPAANDFLTGKGGLWTREVERLARLEKVLESDNNWLNKLEKEFVQQSKKQRLDELKEAEERRKLAVSRQLAAQAELARNQQVKLLQRSILLAIESMHLSPSLEADSVLRSGLNLLPRRITQIFHQVDAVAFSPNGQDMAIVATVELGKTTNISPEELGKTTQIQVYKADTGEQVSAFNRYTDTPGADIKQAIAFSPLDGKYLVAVTVSSNRSNSNDTSHIQIWDIVTGSEVASISNVSVEWHPYISQSVLFAKVAFSPNGKFIATVNMGENTQLVKVWKIETGEEFANIPQQNSIESIAFGPNGEDLYLTAASSDNTAQLRVWNAKTGEEVAHLTTSDDTKVIGFSSDGKYLATKSSESLQVWEISTSRQIARLSEFNQMLQAATFSSDGKYLSTLSGSRKNYEEITNPYIVQVWEVSSGKEVARVPHASYSERNFACSSDGKYLVTGIVGGIQVWETTRSDDKARLVSIPSSSLIVFSADGKYLATQNYDEAKAEAEGIAIADTEEIYIWGTATGNKVASIPQEIVAGLNPKVIALSLDGKYMAATSLEDKTHLIVWEVATKKQLENIPRKGEVKAIVFNPDGKYPNLTVVSIDNTEEVVSLQVWETATEKELVNITNVLIKDTRWVKFAFNSDGKYLAIVSKEVDIIERTRALDVVKVLEVSTGQEVGRISLENFYRIDSIALSSDGQYLAMIGVEDTDERPMYIWEVKTGRPRSRITSNSSMGEIALSQKYLGLQIRDTVHISLWQPEDLINEACTRLNQNLTPQEWRQYFPDEPYRKTCPNLP